MKRINKSAFVSIYHSLNICPIETIGQRIGYFKFLSVKTSGCKGSRILSDYIFLWVELRRKIKRILPVSTILIHIEQEIIPLFHKTKGIVGCWGYYYNFITTSLIGKQKAREIDFCMEFFKESMANDIEVANKRR